MGRYKPRGLGATAKKMILALNSIAMCISLCILSLGAFLKFGTEYLKENLGSLLNKMMTDAEEAGIDEFDLRNFDFATLSASTSTALMVTGLVAVCLSCVGLLSANTLVIFVILPYCVLLGFIILLQVVVIAIVATERNIIDDIVKPPLTSGIANGYKGYNETDITSQGWTFVMVAFSCCGINGYEDFDNAKYWNRKIYQNGFWLTLKSPVPCCKMKFKIPDDFSCAVAPSKSNSNYQTGCYDSIMDAIDGFRSLILACVTVVMLLQLLLFISSIVLTKRIYTATKTRTRKSVYNQRHDHKEANANINQGYASFHRPGTGLFSGYAGNAINRNGFLADFQDNFLNRPYQHVFQSLQPDGLRQFGISALLNAMHTMPAFGVQRQNYGQYSADSPFTMHSQSCSTRTLGDPHMTAFGLKRPSVPCMAIADTAPCDSRRSNTIYKGPVLEEIPDKSRPTLLRQNTAPGLNRRLSQAEQGMFTSMKTNTPQKGQQQSIHKIYGDMSVWNTNSITNRDQSSKEQHLMPIPMEMFENQALLDHLGDLNRQRSSTF